MLKKYEELVIKHYKEPVNGTFGDVTALMSDEDDDDCDTESGAEEDSS